jgi:hypothetical protein
MKTKQSLKGEKEKMNLILLKTYNVRAQPRRVLHWFFHTLGANPAGARRARHTNGANPMGCSPR